MVRASRGELSGLGRLTTAAVVRRLPGALRGRELAVAGGDRRQSRQPAAPSAHARPGAAHPGWRRPGLVVGSDWPTVGHPHAATGWWPREATPRDRGTGVRHRRARRRPPEPLLGAACRATGIGARLELYGSGSLYQRLGPRHAPPLPDLVLWFGPFAAQAAALDGLLQPYQPASVAPRGRCTKRTGAGRPWTICRSAWSARPG